jgi:hypothetical protein
MILPATQTTTTIAILWEMSLGVVMMAAEVALVIIVDARGSYAAGSVSNSKANPNRW